MIPFGPLCIRARLRSVGALAAFASLALFAAPARAEVSSWLSVGAGATSFDGDGRPSQPLRFTLPVDLGVGSPPSGSFVVGAGARVVPYFGEGTAVAAYARAAMQSYVVGGWGAALDAGGFARVDGGDPGVIASLNLGAPWGVILTGSYAIADGGGRAASVTLGVDLLRLTVYRLVGETTWPNPKPAWRPDARAEGAPPAR